MPLDLLADSTRLPVPPGLVGNFRNTFAVVLSVSAAVVGALVLAGLLKSGGSRAATSSVLISSNKLEIPSLNPFDFSVVGVEDVVTSGFSIAEGLNPGGKKALTSSNFNEFNNEGFDEEEEMVLSVVSVVTFVKPNLLVVDS